MKCKEFADLVHEVVGRAGADPAVSIAVRAHAESCPSCGSRLIEARNLTEILHVAAVESRLLETPRHGEARLLNAFRREQVLAQDRSPRKRLFWRPMAAWGGGCAALVLLALALMGRIPGGLYPPAFHPSATSSGSKPSSLREVASSHLPASSSKINLSSGFVPVPFTGSSDPDDWGIVVRVRVPRASLADLGYPVQDAQGGGVVQADLLVGGDGWPRAVRIVP